MASTKKVADTAASKLLGKGNRRLLVADPAVRFPRGKVGTAAAAKKGKTHMGLAVKTSAVYVAVEEKNTNTFGDDTIWVKGDMVMEPQPMKVGYANFDRDVTTVLRNLDGNEIYEERFYLDKDGGPFIPVTNAEIEGQIERYREFLRDMVESEMDLVHIDGGTIIWEDVKNLRLPAPEGKDGSHIPRQYGPANSEMRKSIMQLTYAAPVHVLFTREASQGWDNASTPSADAAGNPQWKPNGWSKTDYYVDVDLMMSIELRRKAGKDTQVRIARAPDTALKPEKMGVEIMWPTYASVYEFHYDAPLLRKQDIATFLELEEEHGRLTW